MTTEQSLEIYGLIPSNESLPAIRKLLAAETEFERTGRQREDDLALLCCVQLFSRGLLEDVLPIWRAKQSGFDLACHLDIQLLCGAGWKETEEFLLNLASDESLHALQNILDNEAEFEDWSPASYVEYWKRYFGVV